LKDIPSRTKYTLSLGAGHGVFNPKSYRLRNQKRTFAKNNSIKMIEPEKYFDQTQK